MAKRPAFLSALLSAAALYACLTLPARAAETLKELPPVLTTKSEIRIWGDQLGYRTTGKKYIIIASSSALPEKVSLTLYSAKTLAPVWNSDAHPETLKPFHEGKKDNESGDYIDQLDLTTFQTPGRYFLALTPDANTAPAYRSYQFNISENPYHDSAVAAWRFFYYQRCDTELPEKYAGPWAHKEDHHGPNQATEAHVYKWTGGQWYSPVGKDIADPTPYDVTGGWWDAGDFDKYMGNTVICANHLLLGQQILHGLPGDNTLNIPESGNKLPDGLDQIKYCTDLLIRMATKEGAGFGKVYENPTCPPEADKSPVQLCQATGGATLNRCAALAYASVVWSDLKVDPAYAKKCMDEAEKSWKLLQEKPVPWTADPKDPKKEKYSGEWFLQDYDQCRALAAACFFKTTGKPEFDKIVHDNFTKKDFGTGDGVDWFPVIAVYMQAKGADPQLIQSMKDRVLKSADNVVGFTGPNRGYAAGLSGYWWGSNRAVGTYGLTCLLASQFTPDAATKQKYLDAAEEMIHYLQGRNPIGMCYLTNMKEFGAEHSAMIMFHSWLGNPSKQKDPFGKKYIGEGPDRIGPPPGYIVGGANGNGTGAMKVYHNDLNDNPWVWNEPDITYQSPNVVVLTYFGFPEAQKPNGK